MCTDLRQLIDQMDNAAQTDDATGHGQAVQDLVGDAALQEHRLAVVVLRE